MSPHTFFQVAFDGLAIGLVYVFMAAGFNLILSVTNVFFIAFGMFYVLGAYFTWDFVQLGVPFFASVVIATIITAFGGALVDMVLFRRIRKSQQSLLKALIASIMLFTIVQQLIMIAFGTEARGIRPIFPGHWKVAGVIIAYDRAAMICVSLVVLIALQLLLHKSRLGRGMRAMSISPEVADLHGVNPPRMGTATFAVGLGLAGFAGGLMAPLFSVSLDMAQSGFIVLLIIMIGGIGSMVGSILSGILLGLIVSFSQFFVSAGVGQMIFFAIVALFFFVRPGGIFGKPQEDPPGEVGYLTQVKRRLSGWQRPVAIGLGLLVVLALPPIIRDPYWVHVLILVVVYAVFGMTFNFGMRAGMINVAGAAFWGVGAYSTALLMTKTGLNYWEALPLTLLISLAIALCLGTIVCRFAGILGMMFSIVFASLIPLVFNTFGFFGKAKGISNLQGVASIGPIHFSSPTSYYYLLIALSIVCILIMLAFNKAWTGKAWLSLASSPRLSQSVGVNPFRYRLISFVVMSMIPAFLGTFYASYLGAVQPNAFNVFAGVDFLICAFLGGLSYFVSGSVVGALVIVLLPEVLRVTGNWELIITSVIVILIVMFLPRGVLGTLDRLPLRRRSAAAAAPVFPAVGPVSGDAEPGAKDVVR